MGKRTQFMERVDAAQHQLPVAVSIGQHSSDPRQQAGVGPFSSMT